MSERHILLVDDEIHVVSILERRFKQSGWTVEIARDGQAACEAVDVKTPDLIVIDYQMPRMNGLETAEALAVSESGAGVPIIMLSARGHLVDQDRLAKTNIKALLRKPFSAREVISAVEELLASDKESAA